MGDNAIAEHNNLTTEDTKHHQNLTSDGKDDHIDNAERDHHPVESQQSSFHGKIIGRSNLSTRIFFNSRSN